MIPARSAAHNLLAGTAAKYCLLLVSIAAGVFLMPFTIRHLGKAEYGLWMLVASITYYFSLLDLGYGNGVVRHIVDADARGSEREMNGVISTFVCVYAVVGLIACVATAALIVFVVPRFPRLSAEDVRTAQWILAILGVRIAIGYPMTVFGAVTNARQGFVINNSIAIAIVVLNALVTYVVLTAGYGVVALVAATTAVTLTGYIGYAWSARHLFPALEIRLRYFSRTQWREVTSFSIYLFVVGLAGQLSFNVDNVVIGAFLGTAAIAVYAVAVRLSDYQRRLCDQFSGMLFPVAVGLKSQGDGDGLRRALVEGTRVGVVLVVGVTTALVAFGEPLIRRWMGPSFEESVAPFYVLALVGVVLVSHAAQQSVLLATGRHRLVAAVWIGEAIANLALSLVLVRPFGAVGVAVGTAIPMAVGHLFVMTPAACRRVGLSIGSYARQTIVPALVGVAPAVVVAVLLRVEAPPSSATAVVLEAGATGACYLAAVLAFGFDAQTRARYLRLVTRTIESTFAATSAFSRTSQNATLMPARTVRGSAGWKCTSSMPPAGSPGSRDV